MRTLTNLMGSVVTGDLIAEAAFAYHRALEARRRATLVNLPVLGERDRVRRAYIAVGWLTGLSSKPEPSSGPEVEDAATANELHLLASALRAGNAPHDHSCSRLARPDDP